MPDAGLVEKVFGDQGAHGTDVRHVRRHLIVQGNVFEGRDLGLAAHLDDAEFRRSRDLVAEAGAALAKDAARRVQCDVRPKVLLRRDALGLDESAVAPAVVEGMVLQLALPGLVAPGTVQGVVDEQELHDPLAVVQHRRGIEPEVHPVLDPYRARGDDAELPGPDLHLGQAHPAVAVRCQAGMIAEMGDVDAQVRRRVDQVAAFFHGILLFVYGNGCHDSLIRRHRLRRSSAGNCRVRGECAHTGRAAGRIPPGAGRPAPSVRCRP